MLLVLYKQFTPFVSYSGVVHDVDANIKTAMYSGQNSQRVFGKKKHI